MTLPKNVKNDRKRSKRAKFHRLLSSISLIAFIGCLLASLLAFSSFAVSSGISGGGTPTTQPTTTYDYYAYVPIRRIYAHFTNTTYTDEYYFFSDFASSVTTTEPLGSYSPGNPLEGRLTYTSPDRNWTPSVNLTWSQNNYNGRADVYVSHTPAVGYVSSNLDNDISGGLYSSVLGFVCDDFFVDMSSSPDNESLESNRLYWYASVNDPDEELYGATYDVSVSCTLLFYLSNGDTLTTNVDVTYEENFAYGGNIVDYGSLALIYSHRARYSYENDGYNLADSVCVVRELTIMIPNELSVTAGYTVGLADYDARITGYAFQFDPMTADDYYASKDYINVVHYNRPVYIDNDFRPLDWLSNVVESFLTLPIFSTQSGINVTLGVLVSTTIMVAIVIIILKMYFGG